MNLGVEYCKSGIRNHSLCSSFYGIDFGFLYFYPYLWNVAMFYSCWIWLLKASSECQIKTLISTSILLPFPEVQPFASSRFCPWHLVCHCKWIVTLIWILCHVSILGRGDEWWDVTGGLCSTEWVCGYCLLGISR